MGPTLLYGDSDTPPHLVAFYDHIGDTEVHILDLTPPPPGSSRGSSTKWMFTEVGNNEVLIVPHFSVRSAQRLI